jgi:hypothetical protein
MRRRATGPAGGHSPFVRRTAVAAVASGLALVVLALAGLRSAREPPNVGTDRARQLAQSGDTAAGATAPATGGPPVPLRRGAPSPAAAAVPVSLRIRSIHVAATVVPTGVDGRTNLVSVPSRVDTLGWYRFSQGLGTTAGSIVIVGHVDDRAQGRGAFFELGRVSVGDRVAVDGADGGAYAFRVIARERFPKTSMPLRRIFARDGAPRLTLITCGGQFDKRRGSYLDNVFVTAVPVVNPAGESSRD